MNTKRKPKIDGAKLRRQAKAKLEKSGKNNTPSNSQRLIHELQACQLKLEKQDEQLAHARAALRQYESMYDFSSVGHFTLAQDGSIDKFNQVGANMLGLKQGKPVKRRFEGFVSTQSHRDFTAFLERVFSANGEEETCEVELIKDKTESFWAHIKGVYDDSYEGYGIIVSDLTSRKQAEETLRQVQANLEESQRISHLGSWIWDLGSGKIQFSEEMFRLVGMVPGEVEVTREIFTKLLLPNEEEWTLRQFLQSADSMISGIEHQFVLPNGQTRCVYSQIKAYCDENGKPLRLLGSTQDITERKQAEAEIQLLAKFPAENPSPVLRINTDGVLLYINKAGLSQLPQWSLQVGEFVPLKLREAVLQSMSAAITQTLDLTHGERIFAFHIAPIAEAGYANLYGSDITDSLQMQALREAEEMLQSMFASTPDSITVVDLNGFIKLCNQATADVHGYSSAEQLIGKNFIELVAEEDRQRAMEGMTQVIINGVLKEVPFTGLKGNGEKFAGELSVSVIKDSSGSPSGFVGITKDVTERKRMESALQKSEERYRELFDNMTEGFALHELIFDDSGKPYDYRFLDINRAFEKLTGFKREDLIGRTQHEALPEEDPFWFKAYCEVVLNGESIHLEHYSLLLQKYYEVYAYRPAPNQFATVFMDISERKKAEEEIRRYLNELQALYENGLAIGSLLDVRQIGNRVITMFEKYLSWHHVTIRLRKEDSNDLELVAFKLPNLKEEDSAEAERIFSTKVAKVGQGLSGWAIQTDQPIRTGNVRLYEQYMDVNQGNIQSGLYMPLKIGERVTGVISVESEEVDAFTEQDERLLATLGNQAAVAFENARLYWVAQQEIAQRKKMEDLLADEKNQLAQRVEERTSDLSRANADLAHALRARDEFLASMSHELRTPLTGILGLSEVLQLHVYGELNDKQQRALSTIEESGHHLLDLINDILDLSRIETGNLELQLTLCAIEDVCEKSLQLAKGLANRKKQNVYYAPAAEPVIVHADARRLKQILVNLLGNAIKFTPEGGDLGLEVQANASEGIVKLIVWDKGIGIKPEDFNKLFKPFTQIDSSFSREYSGTGLGLSLAQRLTEMHNGGIEIESVFGEGSRFTVVLPWTPQDIALISTTPPRSADQLSGLVAPFAQFKIPLVIVADDNETSLQMIGDYLEAKNARVMKVRSGVELLEKVSDFRPDIMLVDIQMPGMDGLETIRRIRSHPNPLIAATPVIAVTALAMVGDRELCLSAGANEYMSKPVRMKELMAAIERLLEDKQ